MSSLNNINSLLLCSFFLFSWLFSSCSCSMQLTAPSSESKLSFNSSITFEIFEFTGTFSTFFLILFNSFSINKSLFLSLFLYSFLSFNSSSLFSFLLSIFINSFFSFLFSFCLSLLSSSSSSISSSSSSFIPPFSSSFSFFSGTPSWFSSSESILILYKINFKFILFICFIEKTNFIFSWSIIFISFSESFIFFLIKSKASSSFFILLKKEFIFLKSNSENSFW